MPVPRMSQAGMAAGMHRVPHADMMQRSALEHGVPARAGKHGMSETIAMHRSESGMGETAAVKTTESTVEAAAMESADPAAKASARSGKRCHTGYGQKASDDCGSRS